MHQLNVQFNGIFTYGIVQAHSSLDQEKKDMGNEYSRISIFALAHHSSSIKCPFSGIFLKQIFLI